MSEKPTPPSIDGIQKSQIQEWLIRADKHIRAGRYLAADEELQKIFAIDPFNEVATSYQDRIQFLIKQFSQRVGVNSENHIEIRKYRDLLAERSRNMLHSSLVMAQKAIEDGYFKKAFTCIARAMSIDSENIYAKELKQRLAELHQPASDSKISPEVGLKFRSVLQESWRNGIPSEEQKKIIKKIAQEMKISDGVSLALEREIKNELYKASLFQIWTTGGISAFTHEAIDNLRKHFAISTVDHSVIEANLLREVRKNKLKGTILIVDPDENFLIDCAQSLRLNFYSVAAAGDLDEGIRTLKKMKPDVIISEVIFDDVPAGFDFFEFIRSAHNLRSIPFIFISKTLDRTTTLIGKRLGVDEFFTKPIDYEMLFAAIGGKIHKTGERHFASRKT